jgi:hypothetical protein
MSFNPIMPAPANQRVTTVPGIYNPISKEQVSKTLFPALETQVISELQMQNWFFRRCPVVGVQDIKNSGFTFTYSWMRTKSESDAMFRPINGRITESNADIEMASTELAQIGNSFSIDFMLTKTGAILDPVAFNWGECIKGIGARLNETFIRGDPDIPADVTGVDRSHGPNTFKGLHALAKDTNWNVWYDPLDLTDIDVIKTGNEYSSSGLGKVIRNNPQRAKQNLLRKINTLSPKAEWIIGNTDAISALSQLGDALGMISMATDDWGEQITMLRGMELVDIGRGAARNDYMIKTVMSNDKLPEDLDGNTGWHHPDYEHGVYEHYAATKLIVGSFGADRLHRITPELNGTVVSVPDWENPREEVNRGWINVVMGLALKNRNCLGMFNKVYLPKSALSDPKGVMASEKIDPITYQPDDTY